jgi:xanthine/CO dehydrogenase XdhC/CoxF family maturation factor
MWVERRNLLQAWDTAIAAGEEVALATIVRVEGSSYRKPGATMLLTRSGSRTGMVSGGCQTYTTSFDEEGEGGYGLGCGGRISLLLERAETARPRIEAIRRSIEHRTASAVVTVIDEGQLPLACKFVVSENRSSNFDCEIDRPLQHALRAAAINSLEQRCSALLEIPAGNAPLTVFVEHIAPPPRLLIFGAGEDAQPVAVLAAAIGWEVVVADGRANLPTPQRFPSAHRLLVLNAEAWNNLTLTTQDAAVILTHSYEQDREILRRMLPLNLRYIGVLGPRRRAVQLVEDIFAVLGHDPGMSEYLDQLHSPAGLDLGADGPEAIALSIIAEIQATLEARTATPLRLLNPAMAAQA